MEEAAKLYADGSVLPGSENQGVDNSRALFAQGAFALWGNASQEAGVFTDQFPCSFDWGVAELPTLTGEVKGALSCSPNGGYVMLSSCENKDAAWEFVKYWTGEECNKARIGMELPVLNSVVESEGIMNEDKFAPFYKMLEQSDGHTPASFIIEDWSEISENLSLSFEQLFNPSAYMDVKEVLKEAAEAQ